MSHRVPVPLLCNSLHHSRRQVINLFRTIDITLLFVTRVYWKRTVSHFHGTLKRLSTYPHSTIPTPDCRRVQRVPILFVESVCGKWWDDKKWFVNKSNQDKSEISSWFIMPQKRIITASLVVESLATVSLQCGWLNVGSSWWRCTEKYRFGFCTRYAY